MPGWMVQHVAALSGVASLDIDASTVLSTWLSARWGSAQPPYIHVNSVWIPYYGSRSSRTRQFVDSLCKHQISDPPQVIVTIPSSSNLRTLARDLELIRATADTWPMAIGLASSALRGGRPHLVQLGGLRRFAEEWDLSIAIDLSGNFDPTWEAEAAIARLGDRLSVLRLRAAAASRSAIGLNRVACRALHAAIERGRYTDIAICAARIFPIPTPPRAAASSVRLAADYIGERTAFHAAALREGIDHFEGSTPSRGA
jgi:hypothetical protein